MLSDRFSSNIKLKHFAEYLNYDIKFESYILIIFKLTLRDIYMSTDQWHKHTLRN